MTLDSISIHLSFYILNHSIDFKSCDVLAHKGEHIFELWSIWSWELVNS